MAQPHPSSSHPQLCVNDPESKTSGVCSTPVRGAIGSVTESMREIVSRMKFVPNGRSWKCEYELDDGSKCNTMCVNDEEALFHARNVHLNVKPFVCRKCSAKFETYYRLRNHGKKCMSKFQVDLRGRWALPLIGTCDNCQSHVCVFLPSTHYRFQNQPVADAVYYEQKGYLCQLCPSKFRSHRYIKEHMRTHSSRQLFSCPICARTYDSPRAIVCHMVTAHSSSDTNNSSSDVQPCQTNEFLVSQVPGAKSVTL